MVDENVERQLYPAEVDDDVVVSGGGGGVMVAVGWWWWYDSEGEW